jgi:hypothetical protein
VVKFGQKAWDFADKYMQPYTCIQSDSDDESVVFIFNFYLKLLVGTEKAQNFD